MKAKIKKTNEIIEVAPYYLHGRLVAYVEKNYSINGVHFDACSRTHLPDELDFDKN